ncbi:MAG: exopolysaccharide biosynthesis polyprenyl glycosylphosphotransferase [Terriglobales bacterium]
MNSIELEHSVALSAEAAVDASPFSIGSLRLRIPFESLLTAFEIVCDGIAVALATLCAYGTYRALRLGSNIQYEWRYVGAAACALAFFFVLMLDRDGAYQKGSSLLRVKETERILRVSATTFLLVFPVTFFAAKLLSRWSVALAFLLVPLFLICEKQLLFVVVRILHERGYGIKKVVIYGAGFTGRRVLSTLDRSPKLGLLPVAVVDDEPNLAGGGIYACAYKRDRSVPVLAGPVTKELLRDTQAEVLVVAIPSISRERFMEALSESAAAGTRFAFVPNQAVSLDLWTDCADVDGLLLSSIAKPAPKWLYELFKRVFDSIVAAALLLLLSPLLIAIAVAVRMDSPGPALFRQKRVGRNGKIFMMHKFRSMRMNAPQYSFSPKTADDPRITRVGRFLRRTSLDELPQLIDVLKGDMSLVGPRPEMPFIVEQYSPREHQRLQVVPGITGLWQLSADRAFLIHENIQYDLYYIRNRNFFMDLAILLHTLVFAMRGI